MDPDPDPTPDYFSPLNTFMKKKGKDPDPDPYGPKTCESGSGSPKLTLSSVADPGYLSRIPDPDFYPSRISDPGSRIPVPKTATKERGEKKFFSHTFLCSHKFHKIENYFRC
jgi:hypothetical protein